MKQNPAPPPERRPESFEVRNPRYAEATPEDVARSLFRPVKPRGEPPRGDRSKR